jgi:hypothetical protein
VLFRADDVLSSVRAVVAQREAAALIDEAADVAADLLVRGVKRLQDKLAGRGIDPEPAPGRRLHGGAAAKVRYAARAVDARRRVPVGVLENQRDTQDVAAERLQA